MLVLALLSGCSRKAPEHGAQPSASDTLANGLPRALVPGISAWVGLWRRSLPEFAADSLVLTERSPFQFDFAWRGARSASDRARARAGVLVMSPDSARSLDVDMYVEFDRDQDRKIQIGREPDSAPVLADYAADTLWRVAFCGTPCFYDGAHWVDASRFALTGATEEATGALGPWRAFLEIYDLRTRRRARWLGPPVDESAFDRYREASDSALVARVQRAGLPNVPERLP